MFASHCAYVRLDTGRFYRYPPFYRLTASEATLQNICTWEIYTKPLGTAIPPRRNKAYHNYGHILWEILPIGYHGPLVILKESLRVSFPFRKDVVWPYKALFIDYQFFCFDVSQPLFVCDNGACCLGPFTNLPMLKLQVIKRNPGTL